MKGLFRFFKWIFGYKEKYAKKNEKYQRKSLSSKIFAIIGMFLMAAGSLAFGYFVIPVTFETNVVVAFLSIFLYISVCAITFENLIMYSVLGFRNMFISTIEKFADKKIHEFETRNFDYNEEGITLKEEKLSKEEYNEIAKDRPKKRYYRGIDLIIGILGVVLAIAFIFLAFLVGFQVLYMLTSNL